MIALHIGLAVSSLVQKSVTYDEVAHLTAGTSFWYFDDYRLQPENGNLPQRWFGLSANLSEANFPDRSEAWKASNVWALGDSFLHDSGNDPTLLLFRGRLMAVCFSVALCGLVFLWSRRLFGNVGGLISLLLCVLSPTVLAHGRLMTSDVCTAFHVTAAVWGIWSCLHRVTIINLSLTALAVAAAFLSKLSAVLLIPIAILMVSVKLVRGQHLVISIPGVTRQLNTRRSQLLPILATATLCACVTFCGIWGAFGFRYDASPQEDGSEFYVWNSDMTEGEIFQQSQLISTMAHYRVLPEAYLYGAAFVLAHEQRDAFLAGSWSKDGFWYFFPFVVLVKTPLPSFVLVGASMIFTVRQTSVFVNGDYPSKGLETQAAEQFCERNVIGKIDRKKWRGLSKCLGNLYPVFPLLAIWLIFWPFLLSSSLNIGQRHALPIYLPAFILSGASAHLLSSKQRWRCIALLIVLLWVAVEAARAHPHYLAYFNQIIPRHQAYRYVVDSSLDWGQDLPELARWLEANTDDSTPVYLSYFGNGRPSNYGIESSSIFDAPLEPGLYCISATSLQYGAKNWTREHESLYREVTKGLRAAREVHGKSQIEHRLQSGDDEVVRLIAILKRLAPKRLLAHLWARSPDATVGYSVLVYRVSSLEVAEALNPNTTIRGPKRLSDA